jgi:hypothetical protein
MPPQPNNTDEVVFTVTVRQATLLYFKCEWILASGTVEENNRLARDILNQIQTQYPGLKGIPNPQDLHTLHND